MAKETTWPDLREKLDPKTKQPVKGKHALEGKEIEIKGFMLPLDFEAKKISEFLLVPYVPSCMHVPPPPADQVIYVKMKNAAKIEPSFYPILMKGKIFSDKANFEMIESGWKMEGLTIKEIK